MCNNFIVRFLTIFFLKILSTKVNDSMIQKISISEEEEGTELKNLIAPCDSLWARI